MMALAVFVYVVCGTLPYFSVTMNYVSRFIVIYIIASYIRLYPRPVYDSLKVWLASAFGVLCIHANSDTMRQWLWKDVVNCVGLYDHEWLPVPAVGWVLAIYIVCTIIDQIRIRLIEKPVFDLWDRMWRQ